MSLTVSIEKNDVTGQMLDAAGPVTRRESKAMAAEVTRLVQRHLRTRDSYNAHRYPEGGRRSHFWRKAAQSVTWDTDPDGITIAVTHQGVRLRYAGAPQGIAPVNAKALAIPATGEAYGRSPREFPDLRVVVFKGKNRVALVRKPADGELLGTVMFWLIKRTKPIAPDHTVLPPHNVVLGLAMMRLTQLRTRKEQANG